MLLNGFLNFPCRSDIDWQVKFLEPQTSKFAILQKKQKNTKIYFYLELPSKVFIKFEISEIPQSPPLQPRLMRCFSVWKIFGLCLKAGKCSASKPECCCKRQNVFFFRLAPRVFVCLKICQEEEVGGINSRPRDSSFGFADQRQRQRCLFDGERRKFQFLAKRLFT